MSDIKSNFITSKKRMTMKKQELFTLCASLLALFLLNSSFTYLSNATAIVQTKQTFWTTMSSFSYQNLGFWQKASLCLAASSGSYLLFRRRYRHHYDEGFGCIGVLGIIVLGALVIALLPLILVVGLFMLIFGVSFPNFRGRRYGHDYGRRRRYERRRW